MNTGTFFLIITPFLRLVIVMSIHRYLVSVSVFEFFFNATLCIFFSDLYIFSLLSFFDLSIDVHV
jgi:hypothetical protein